MPLSLRRPSLTLSESKRSYRRSNGPQRTGKIWLGNPVRLPRASFVWGFILLLKLRGNRARVGLNSSPYESRSNFVFSFRPWWWFDCRLPDSIHNLCYSELLNWSHRHLYTRVNEVHLMHIVLVDIEWDLIGLRSHKIEELKSSTYE